MSSLDDARLAHRIKMIEALEAHLDGRHWDLAKPGSDLARDDARTGHLQTSHVVGSSLAAAIDFVRSARFMLQDPEVPGGTRLPLVGQYPVLRASLEASALAVWILQSEERRERLGRTLRARWEDIIQDNQAVLAMTAPTDEDTKTEVAGKHRMRRENAQHVGAKKRRLREIAQKSKIPLKEVELGLPGFGPIIDAAARSGDLAPNHVHGWWRMVSGVSHPSASRMLTMSMIEEKGERVAGTFMAEMTAKPAYTTLAIEAALHMHFLALELAAERGGREEIRFRFPKGFPVPPGYEHLAAQSH
jgi:hypothetical protein